jgi:hypothetical protein
MFNIYIKKIRQRKTYTILTLAFYKKVLQADHNKINYHKVRFVRKLKCKEHDALDYGMISRYRLVTFTTNYNSNMMCTKANTFLLIRVF